MTRLDNKFVSRNGIVSIRFIKPDGGYHRTSIEPGQDPDFVMAQVNAHLESMGHTKVDDSGLAFIRTVVKDEHTPQVIAAFKAAQKTKV